MKLLFSIAFATLVVGIVNRTLAHPEIPGAIQEKPIALVNATIHPVTAPAIDEGAIVFDNGKIIALGTNASIPAEAERIDVQGKHVYPGLINPSGNLGLIEINSVRATLDYAEAGRMNPNVRAEVAVNPDSELIPVTRSNGVLFSLSAPSGGLITGTSVLLQLDGWTWEDMTLKSPIGMHVRWPRMRATPEDAEPKENEQIKALRDAFNAARSYQKAKQNGGPREIDLRHESLLPVLDRQVPLIIEGDTMLQIQSAVAFSQQQNVRMILEGGFDAPLCAELLKRHQIPVIVGGVLRLPRGRSDDYDVAYTLPDRLRRAGLQFCIAGTGRFDAANARNLPYQAAMAAAFGLPKNEALKSITIYAAEIFGVADRIGSLEVNKDASLIITTGDPLETATQVEAAFIEGRKVDLNNRQKRLWKKYQTKYRRS